ncbi:hypothetical protein [Actinomycetospora cinnamomea]|uniref:Uncharacterized protein n=1 Tax=Actinomycetospora cinnamomea TaxID=663609 RepID=A0A2U1EC41_9PSEU|nr:hypothetical protein [Actinomycetospora cinnamomea]PVY97514.1 hypothetical protein C8D89_12451 [Actinomycetospora cinnamomea]
MTAHDMSTREMNGEGTPTTARAPGAYPESYQQSYQQPRHTSEEPARDEGAGRPTRWGPAWTGTIVAVPVFIVLEMLFTAFGWLSLGVDGAGAGAAASIVSAVLAIIALFVGGLAGGTASGSQRAASADPALQGAMIWGLTTVVLIVLGAVGGTVLAGTVGSVGAVAAGGAGATVQAVQTAAGWTALWLGVAFVAAVGGSIVGAGGSGKSADAGEGRNAG